MSTHVRAVLESTWSTADAVAWADDLGRWPRRRYRVEGSRCGPSRLVRHRVAVKLQRQYGGTVVEVIPPYRTRERQKWQEVYDGLPVCPRPWCAAKPGEPCKDRLKPHVLRARLKEQLAEVVNLEVCPACGVGSGVRCMRAGKPRAPHLRRRPRR